MKKDCRGIEPKILRVKLVVKFIASIITRNDKNNDKPKDME
jgi:hypothetical protein